MISNFAGSGERPLLDTKCRKNLVEVDFVLIQGLREDDNIIQVDNAAPPGFTKGTQGLVHGSLKNRWGVDQAHWHDHEFVEPFVLRKAVLKRSVSAIGI